MLHLPRLFSLPQGWFFSVCPISNWFIQTWKRKVAHFANRMGMICRWSVFGRHRFEHVFREQFSHYMQTTGVEWCSGFLSPDSFSSSPFPQDMKLWLWLVPYPHHPRARRMAGMSRSLILGGKTAWNSDWGVPTTNLDGGGREVKAGAPCSRPALSYPQQSQVSA